MGKYAHFVICVEDVNHAYNVAIKAGFDPFTPHKVVPLESKPEKIAINITFVKGPDREEVEFFKQV